MSRIDRTNYEIFLIDFLEDNLSEDLRQEVVLFLEHNPDIAEEFDGLDEMILPEIDLGYSFKNQLKHKELKEPTYINHNNYQNYFIKAVEQDLTQVERNDLLLFLQINPSLSSEFELFYKTKVKAETHVVFKDKFALKDIAISAYASLHLGNYQEKFVAYHENELDENEEQDVLAFVALNPHTKTSFDDLSKVYFQTDTTIQFADKELLKKRAVLTPRFSLFTLQRIAVAATISFVMFFSWKYYQDDKGSIEQLPLVHRGQYAHQVHNFKVFSNEVPEMESIEKQIIVASKTQPVTIDNYPQIDMINSHSETLEMVNIARIDASSVVELEVTEPPLDIIHIHFAPLSEHMNSPTNLVEYASVFMKSQKPYWNGFQNKAKNIWNNENLEYRGIGIWDIAEIGILGFNQLTENDYRINRSQDSP